MSHDDAPKRKKKHRIPKALRKLLSAVGVFASLVAAAMLLLPFALSSEFARARIVQAVSQATGKPASLGTIAFSWGEGLRLDGLSIGRGGLRDSEFLCSLDSLRADAGLLSLLRGKARLTLELKGLRLRVVPGQATPQQPAAPKTAPLPQVLRQGFAALRAGLEPMRLPLDAALLVDLSDATVRIAPQGKANTLELRNITFRLDAPSVKHAQIVCRAALDPVLGDAPLDPIRLDARIDALCNADGRLDLAHAQVSLELAAPGAHAAIHGAPATGLKSELRADLRQCATAYGPVLPGLPELDGSLAVGLTLAQSEKARLKASLLVFADALCAGGGPLGGKSFGPLTMSLLQEAELDGEAETAQLPGSLDMAGHTQARWRAGLDGVRDGKPSVTLDVGPLDMDLAPLLAAAKGMLPPGLAVGAAKLRFEGLRVDALLPQTLDGSPQVEASARALSLDASGISRRDKTGLVRIGRAQISLDKALAALPSDGQGSMELQAAMRLDGIRMDGPTPVAVAEAELRRLSIHAERLAWDKAALFGVTGEASVELDAEARNVEARSPKARVAAPSITKRLRLRAQLPPEKAVLAKLEGFEVSAPKVAVAAQGKTPIEAPLTLTITAPEIRLTRPAEGAPPAPAVQNALIGLDIGGALHSSARVSLSGPDSRRVSGDGTVTLNAQRLLALAAAIAPRQAKASGAFSADWKLDATLPQPAAKAPPAKLMQRLKSLNFLHLAEAELTLRDLSLDWPLAAKPGKAAEVLRLRGLATPKPLRMATRNGVQESSLSGSLAFGPLAELPGAGALDRPLKGLVTITARQEGARSAQVSEMLRLDGHDIEQNLTLVLDKLDLVLDSGDKPTAALENLDATLGLRLAGSMQALPARQGKAATLGGSGSFEAGAELRLAGGRNLAVSARLSSPGLDLRLGPDMELAGLKSSLRFQRRFSIARGLLCPGDAVAEYTPLSEQVFDQFPAASPARQQAGSLAQILAPGASRGLSSVSLQRVRLKAAGLPLELRDLDLRLDTASAVPGLRSFRAGLLGGSVLGSAGLRKNAGRYSLDAELAFSGVDPGRFFPAKAAKDLGDRAEASGRVSLSVPLTPDPETLLQRLFLRADITRIGPRTLERMLYALDPDEQNETIVQQRRLMDMGYPRNLRVAIAYGNLSLSGAVEVKGFQLDLPPVDRLNISNLPVRDKLAAPLSAVPGLVRALDAISGTVICRDKDAGRLRVAQPAEGATP
jgi:uncharacterized protein involved in outer membrane biogenesis